MRLFAIFATLYGAAGLCLGAAPAFGQQAGNAATTTPGASDAATTTPAPAPAAAPAPVSAPAPAPTTTTGPGQFKSYRINTGDDLEVNVWGEERLQREVRVLPDGTFTFPLVGQIVAAGKLPSEVAADITNGLKTQYRDNVPTVTVSVKGAGGFQFAVTGKVKTPGTFTPSRYVNVLDALIMAGGPAEFANVDNVVVLRKNGYGHVTAIKVHLSRIFKGDASARDMADLPELESGDTVIVP